MSQKIQEPIIVVKKKGRHHGHHGGAWKVAYADFVTAMMAFFLVMWLVGQKQEIRAAVAGYFRDPGVLQYDSGRGVLPGGGPGVEPDGRPQPAAASAGEDADGAERRRLAAAGDRIRQQLMQAQEFAPLRDQIEVTVTAEGLRIELVEQSGSSFFDSGSAVLLGESVRILQVIAAELGRLSNDIVIEGHTDSRQYAGGTDGYGNWELSADRANAARRIMMAAGVRRDQLRTVRGFADTQLHLPDPFDARNRRVSIVVRSQAAASLERAVQASGSR
ncbi:MAG: OmpA family protein [Acidobacteria bacterium]|nr:OmpA family protein [Acidobacteriota bacterium]